MKFIKNLARPLLLDFAGALKKNLAQHTQLLIFKRNLRSIIRWFANDLC